MFRNWILQDFSHAFPPRSLQAIGTTSFHTSHMKNRGFWNIFEFSRKPDNSKDSKKLSVDESRISDRDKTSLRFEKSNDDTSKDVITSSRTILTNSKNVYSYKDVPRCNYAFRYVPRVKSKRKNSKTNFHKYEGLTSLLDGDPVTTKMKLKLKGCKTLRNVRAEEYAFVKGDRTFDFDVMATKNEVENIPNELYKVAVSRDVTRLVDTLSSNVTNDHGDMESNVSSNSKKNLSLNDINRDENESYSTTTTLKSTSKEARDSSYDIARLNENKETTNELLECWYRSEEGPERIGTNRIVPCEIREDASALRKSGDIERDEYEDERVRLKSDVKSINRSNDELSLKRNDSHCDQPRDPTYVTSNSTILRKRGMTDAAGVAVGSSPSCGMTFRKANDNPTNQRWSGFDRGSAVNRCYTVRSSRSRVSGSRGSTYPYSPTLQTREASSKCYNVPKDPIVRSNIIGSPSRILRTRNSVTGSAGVGTDCSGYMTTRNIDNPKLYSNVDTTNRIFLGSKSSTGIAKAQQAFAYGSCKKPKSKCCPKKRKDTCDEPMIPGKVICTKPQRKSCCPKPKCCQPVEKKPSCPPEVPPLRPSCCQAKPRKKKICKRYCCPSLKDTDCFASRGTCPGQCVRDAKSDYLQEDDPSCLPPKEEMSSCQRKSDCDDDDNNNNNNNNNNCESDCNTSRSMCTGPKKCTRSFSCMDSGTSCLDTIQSRQGLCKKPKKRRRKDCCKRNSRRSKSSCGNRRYHSGTTKFRRTKSYVKIPLFDVSVVSYRPYQNDAVLRFYSSCENDRKQNDRNEDSSECKKPDPPDCSKVGTKCESVCAEPITRSTCTTTNRDRCDDKPKGMDTCAVKRTDEIRCKSKTDLPGGKDRKEVYQVRWERELREIRECKGIGKKEESCKSGKSEDLGDNVIGSSRKKKCDKFESIDSTTINDDDLYPRSISYNQIGNSFDVPFGTVPIGTSLLNFGMRSNNVIPNRSFSMTKMTMDIQREELPILVENESIDKESPDEESSSE